MAGEQQIERSLARLMRKKPFAALGLAIVLLAAVGLGWAGGSAGDGAGASSRNCEEGVIASSCAKSLASPGAKARLPRDVSEADRYGRLLCYVWLERPEGPSNEGEIAGKMLNAILVRGGYAQAKRCKPDTALYGLFERWGNEAIAEGRGVARKWA